MKRMFSTLKNLFSKDPNEKFNEKFYEKVVKDIEKSYEKVVKDMKDDEQFRRVRRYSDKFHGDEVNRPLQKFGTTFGNIMVEVTEDDKLSNEVKVCLNVSTVSRLLDHLLRNLVSSSRIQRYILEDLLKLHKDEERANMLREVEEKYGK